MRAKFLISSMILMMGLGVACRPASFQNIDKSGLTGANGEGDGLGAEDGDGRPGGSDANPNLDPSDSNKPIDPTQGGPYPVDPDDGKGKLSLTVTLSQPTVKMGENKVQAKAKLSTTSASPKVTWSLSGPMGQLNIGTIDQNGVYTSPRLIDTSFPISVIATLIADPNIKGMAPLTIEPNGDMNPNKPILTVTTPVDSVQTGENKVPATARLNTSMSTPSVTWSIVPPSSISDPGSIDQNGVYTSPKNAPFDFPITIVATLKSDPSIIGMKAIIVKPVATKPTLTVTTPSPEIKAGEEKMQASSKLSNTSDKPDVYWTVMGPAGRSDVGKIDQNGLYTSPKDADKEFQVVITAVLKSDPTISGSTTIRVIPKDVIFARCTKGNAVFPIVADVYQIPANSEWLPDFSNPSVARRITTVCMDEYAVAPRNFTSGFPDVPGVFEWFALNTKTTLVAPEDGTYTFVLNSDDGSKLYIDGKLVINNDGQHQAYGSDPQDSQDQARLVTKTVYLNKGDHDLRVDYFQGPRERIALELKWKLPSWGSSRGAVYVPRENFK